MVLSLYYARQKGGEQVLYSQLVQRSIMGWGSTDMSNTDETPGSSSTPSTVASPPKDPKTCVILVHGMGEQKPMMTLWDFVKTVWTRDPHLEQINKTDVFSKPDGLTGNFELRRVTTLAAPTGQDQTRRMDFYEFYWAHLMQGNKLGHLLFWLKPLFLRWPRAVPPRLHSLWVFGSVVITLLILLFALAFLHPAVAVIAAVVSTLLGWFVVPTAGDAARYLEPSPTNVETRQKIREAGVELLTKLSETGKYDRIVMVGHSLGSVIAYDVLTHAWARIQRAQFESAHAANGDAMPALNALEKAARELTDAPTRDPDDTAYNPLYENYREAQKAYWRVLATADKPVWLVSDLITLGSPLSKADVLLTRKPEEFIEQKRRRDLPTSPPVFEEWKGERTFSYPLGEPTRVPHHAAVFGATIWTNIYFEHKIVLGDPISGPVAPWFGPGVKDIGHQDFSRFRHTHYWKQKDGDAPSPWVTDLRKALSLMREP
jgi:hypothetical protein